MKNGSRKQRDAYTAINELRLIQQLKNYQPVLCGTIPLGIDLDTSDLDIIMEVEDLNLFERTIHHLYRNKPAFYMKRTNIRGREVVKANFWFNNFEFELFAQHQPVHQQNAYLHMLIEYKLLQNDPTLKEKILQLKKQGYTTEEAFCKRLNISGDPYEGLIRYGRKTKMITGTS
ncbi:DUF4269 domain-containing protein [Halobacillus fulvus]|nr:DUF4269 domain-containing protein [Halobacillus fulvus]